METKMKMKKFGRRKVSIPDEIIFDIFSWLRVKSLMRFKCVSGFCNSLVSESHFSDIHRCHSMTRPGTKLFLRERKAFYSVEQEKGGNISASLFQPERFIEPTNKSRMNCANGLFCVWEPSTVRSAIIFNPSTREVRFLPPRNNCGNYSIGFEPQENKYKVFFSEKQLSGYIKQWVLTLGIDESWRETQSNFPSLLYGKPSVCISGVIYQFDSAPESAIAAFDVKSENFEIITLWNESTWLYFYHLIEVKGKLAVVDYHMVNHSFDLWILEHSPKREWKRHVIRFPSKWNYKVPRPISSCISRDGKIVLIRNFNSSILCWCYDLIATRKRRRWRKLEIKGLPEETGIYGIYSYVETLVDTPRQLYPREHQNSGVKRLD